MIFNYPIIIRRFINETNLHRTIYKYLQKADMKDIRCKHEHKERKEKRMAAIFIIIRWDDI